MAHTSSSAKQWGGVERGAEVTSADSAESYTIRELRLAETRRDALGLIRASRKEKAVSGDSSASKSVVARVDKGIYSASHLSTEDTLVEGLNVEEYRRMVDGRLGDPNHKYCGTSVGIHTSQKSLDASVVNLDDDHQPSTPMVFSLAPLHDKIHVVENPDTPVRSNAIVEEGWKKPADQGLQQAIVKERDPVLQSLDLQIKLTEAKFAALGLIRKQKKPVEEDAFHKPFASLTAEEEEEVSVALNGSNRREPLVMRENSNIEITRNIFQCLLPGAWLNDELAGGRNGYDFKAVRRWTTYKKIGYSLIQCDKIFVPIHKGIHWCLAVINIRDKKFQYLDSLRGMDHQVFEALVSYVADEVKDKSDTIMDFSSWEHEFVVNLPEQQNGWDCGMFMIKYVFYSRGMSLSFSQNTCLISGREQPRRFFI